MYWRTRLCSHGRCCGFSKVQKLRLTRLAWPSAGDATAAAPAAPIRAKASRRDTPLLLAPLTIGLFSGLSISLSLVRFLWLPEFSAGIFPDLFLPVEWFGHPP